MSDEAALLAAIIAHPDEDTHRLVYADWLQENGREDRAEFIRVQVELASLPEPEEVTIFPGGGRVCKACQRVRGGSGLCRVHELRRASDPWSVCRFRLLKVDCPECDGTGRQSKALNATSIASWPCPACEGEGDITGLTRRKGPRNDYVFRFDFRRGFPESVRCSAADWLAKGDAIRAAHPVTKVVLTTRPEIWMEHGPRFGFDGRERARDLGADALLELSGTEIRARMLQAEWPGVTFTIPPG